MTNSQIPGPSSGAPVLRNGKIYNESGMMRMRCPSFQAPVHKNGDRMRMELLA